MLILKALRFFNIGFSDIEDIDFFQALTLIKSMERLEAQETLMQLKIMDYPNMKDEARTRLHKEIKNKAFDNEQKTYSFDEIENIFKGF